MTEPATPGDHVLALADRFFAAIKRGDLDAVRGCYAANAVIWHNTDGLEQDREANLAQLTRLIARTTTRRYADRRIVATTSGFVQQHRLLATRRDGYILDLPVCIICRVEGDSIVRLDEYMDGEALIAWFTG